MFIKTVINTTGESVYSTLSEFMKEHCVAREIMISICTEGAPSMVGKRHGASARILEDTTISTIHCAFHRENLIVS